MLTWYDKYGKKIELDDWCKLTSNREYSNIRKTKLWNGKLVSTVWLGLDHSCCEKRIKTFETMVFKKGQSLDMERYSSLEEAEFGHEEMVKKWNWKLF
jgi:hypothetical protein